MFECELRSIEDALRLIHPDDKAEHQAKLEQVAKEGGSYNSQYRIRRPDTGSTAWLEERGIAILDENQEIRSILGIVVDVTERKLVEEELRRKNNDLTKANHELEEFAYVSSHDLQEPLRMINIYWQLLLRRDGLRDDAIASHTQNLSIKALAGWRN